MIVFSRPINDHIPIPPGLYRPRKEWSDLSAKREECFIRRHYAKAEDLTLHSRNLAPLQTGDNVYIQDQTGNTPRKWNKSGANLEFLPHDSYLVKVDGSGHVTKHNRKFLRKFTPSNNSHAHVSQSGSLPFWKAQPTPPGAWPESQESVTADSTQASETHTQPEGTQGQGLPNAPERSAQTNARRKPVKEKWIVNPDYPSMVPNKNKETSLTAQGLLTDPACQALGGGHREDQDTEEPGPIE